jgi:hypothetical protein
LKNLGFVAEKKGGALEKYEATHLTTKLDISTSVAERDFFKSISQIPRRGWIMTILAIQYSIRINKVNE